MPQHEQASAKHRGHRFGADATWLRNRPRAFQPSIRVVWKGGGKQRLLSAAQTPLFRAHFVSFPVPGQVAVVQQLPAVQVEPPRQCTRNGSKAGSSVKHHRYVWHVWHRAFKHTDTLCKQIKDSFSGSFPVCAVPSPKKNICTILLERKILLSKIKLVWEKHPHSIVPVSTEEGGISHTNAY